MEVSLGARDFTGRGGMPEQDGATPADRTSKGTGVLGVLHCRNTLLIELLSFHYFLDCARQHSVEFYQGHCKWFHGKFAGTSDAAVH
ncbi:hypothetical protein [Aromatoleum sp.]|uniref:hypothetical protein n=1 Tax=Aromatoleum sp. TaxID=2307007 RepID=UPI002FC8BC71